MPTADASVVEAFSAIGATFVERIKTLSTRDGALSSLGTISDVSQRLSPDLSTTNQTVIRVLRRLCELSPDEVRTGLASIQNEIKCSTIVSSYGATGHLSVQLFTTLFNVVSVVYTLQFMSWETAMFIMPSGWVKMYETLTSKSPVAIAFAFIAFHYTDFTSAYATELQRVLDEAIGAGLHIDDAFEFCVSQMSSWAPSSAQVHLWVTAGRRILPEWMQGGDVNRCFAVLYKQVAGRSRQIVQILANQVRDKMIAAGSHDGAVDNTLSLATAASTAESVREVLTLDMVSEIAALDLASAASDAFQSSTGGMLGAVSMDDFAEVEFGDDKMSYVEYRVELERRLDRWAEELASRVREAKGRKKHFTQGDRRRVVREMQIQVGGHDSSGTAVCATDAPCRRRAKAIPFNSKTGRKRVWCESECEASLLGKDQQPWCYVNGAHFADNPGAYRKRLITGRPWMYCENNSSSDTKMCDIGLEYGKCE